MELDLTGRCVIVTGASAGIGRATALALAAEGAQVALGARRSDALEAVAAEVSNAGGKAVTHAGDLTVPNGIGALVDEARATFGEPYGLVTCVGSTPLGTFDVLGDTEWQQAIDMKLLATIRGVQAVLPHMREAGLGRLILLAGNIAQEPTPHLATSGVVNAALGNLAGTLTRSYAAEGVSAVCVNPGPVRTDRYQALVRTTMARQAVDEAEAAALIADSIPSGRPAEPAEVGMIITTLLSPRLMHLSGTTVTVDAGQTWAR